MKLNEIFKNTSYDDTLFSSESIATIEQGIFTKKIKGREVPYFKCFIREKDIKLTPEKAVQQVNPSAEVKRHPAVIPEYFSKYQLREHTAQILVSTA